jgi:hypothetical protein
MSRRRAGATVDGVDTFDRLLARWIDAEARGDAAALDALLHADFQGDGPRGYVLTKPEWLDRYRRRDLVHDAFTWELTRVRQPQADTVFARGIQTQDTRCGDDDCSGRFLATLVAVRRDDRWAIVNLQLSRLDGPARPLDPASTSASTSATSVTDIGQVADVADEG